MHTITVSNEKGGVGKTVIAVNIAAGLAMRGRRVLLIDTDAQAQATISLGLKKYPGLYDYLVRNAEPDRVIARIHPAVYGGQAPALTPQEMVENSADEQKAILQRRAVESSRLHVLGGNVESYHIANSIRDAARLAERLTEIADQYDFCLLDTSPTPSMLHTAIYLATDSIVYPVECEYLGLDGLQESLSRLDDIRRVYGKAVRVIGLIPNKYRMTTTEHTENLAVLKERFGALVWPSIPLSIVWGETAGYGVPVFVHAPGHDAVLNLWEVLDRVEGAVKNAQPA